MLMQETFTKRLTAARTRVKLLTILLLVTAINVKDTQVSTEEIQQAKQNRRIHSTDAMILHMMEQPQAQFHKF